jgi:putative spermidine/putrescine transport system ATP-binding protein
MTPSSEVQLVALTKIFGRTVAVDAISAEIPAGSYCCLLGPSGCGKTTTLRMIAGHEVPTSGEIIVGGTCVTPLPPTRRRTAMMFQSDALFPHLNCVDNLAFSLRMRGVPKAERRAKARDMLRIVEMEPLAERSRLSSPAGSSSASRSLAPSSPTQACSCSTNRCPRSIRSSARACARS